MPLRGGGEEIADHINTNYKYFYSYAKRFSNMKIGIVPLLDTANTLVTSPKKISEFLSQQYSSVFNSLAYDSTEINNLFMGEVTIPNGLSDIDFGEEAVIDAMSKFISSLLKQSLLDRPPFPYLEEVYGWEELYQISVRNPILHPYIKERVEPFQRTIILSLLPLGWSNPLKRSSTNNSSTSWWAWFVKWQPTWLSKSTIMLEPTFGPFRPYHSPPGAWTLRRCSLYWLHKGVRQGRHWYHPEHTEIPRNPRIPWQVALKLPQWPPPISASWRKEVPVKTCPIKCTPGVSARPPPLPHTDRRYWPRCCYLILI